MAIVLLVLAAGTAAGATPRPVESPGPGGTAVVSGPSSTAGAAPGPAFLPSEEQTVCGVAVPERLGPRRPHPPVRVDGSDPEESPTLATAPAAHQPVYRPGSGIVAGNGTEENPFVIAGWRLPRLMIQHTDQHFVVADNRFQPRMEPTGLWVDRPDQIGLLPAHYVEDNSIEYTRIVDAPNVSVVRNVGDQEVRVEASPGFCLGNNTLRPYLDGEGAALCASPDARILENDGLKGLSLRGSPHATVRNNTFHVRGVISGWYHCGIDFSDRYLDRRPAYFDHTIPPSNTVDGEPIRYLKDTADREVGPPVGQVLLHNVSNVTVAGIDQGRLEATYSDNVTIENVTTQRQPDGTAYRGHQILVTQAPNITLRHNDLRTPLDFEGTPDAVFANNSLEPALHGPAFTRAPRTLVADNHLEPGATKGVTLTSSPDSRVVRNQIDDPGTGVLTYGSDDVIVRNNTIVDAQYGVELRTSSDVRIVDNRIPQTGLRGVLANAAPGLNVSHNAVAGTSKETHLRVGILIDNDGNIPGEAPEVMSNEVEHTDFAVQIVNPVRVVEVHGNNLGTDVDMGVTNPSDGRAVAASGNWWGCPDGPSSDACSDVFGDVVVSPWLEEPNPDAGPRE